MTLFTFTRLQIYRIGDALAGSTGYIGFLNGLSPLTPDTTTLSPLESSYNDRIVLYQKSSGTSSKTAKVGYKIYDLNTGGDTWRIIDTFPYVFDAGVTTTDLPKHIPSLHEESPAGFYTFTHIVAYNGLDVTQIIATLQNISTGNPYKNLYAHRPIIEQQHWNDFMQNITPTYQGVTRTTRTAEANRPTRNRL